MSRSSWALFLSGKGSTANAAMEMISSIDIKLVISNNPSALGLLKAKRAGIPTLVFQDVGKKNFKWHTLIQELKIRKINRIFLLGFMKIVSEQFINSFQQKIWNIHPSLLPLYPGLHAMEKSWADQSPMGVTIHEVIPEMDAGQKIVQKKLIRKESWDEMLQSMSQTEQELIRKVLIKKDFYAKL